MNKLNNVILKLFIVILFSGLFFLGSTDVVIANNVDAHFKVKLAAKKFQVSTILEDLSLDNVYIKFKNQGVGKENIAKRIKKVKAYTINGESLPLKHIEAQNKVYAIKTKGREKVKINYTLNPDVAWWDHHFSVIEKNYTYIPIEYFIFEAFSDSNCNKVIYDSVKFYFTNLSKGWEILTTCPIYSDDSTEVEGKDSIIYAGKYKIKTIKKGDSIFQIAINQGLDIKQEKYLNKFKKIIDYQYSMFEDYIYSEALIVINPKPDYSSNYGGQSKEQNVIIFTDDLERNPAQDKQFLSHFAHETFHLWLSNSFEQRGKSMYWFTEGFTNYQEYRTLWKLGIINQEEFYRNLAREYVLFERVQKKKPISLIKSGEYAFKSDDYRILNYNKGAIIAYLLDKKLRSKGKSFNGLMKFIHNKYAEAKIPIENKEIVLAINDYLGNNKFTRKWILNYQAISKKDVQELKPYIFKERLKQFVIGLPLVIKMLVGIIVIFILFILIRKLHKK